MREHITFGFVGIGLIGGSVAKALRRVYPSCKIIVYNRSAEPRVMAINDGTANVAVPQVDETFNECDYIFLCTPVEKNVEYLKILKDIIKDDCIITDVGSVKGNIHKAVKELGLEKNFIGGHPMAGSEKTSYTYANDRLVENAYYAITPTDAVSKERVEEFTEIVQGIGAIPINISYEEHDKVVATISHLPHLIAASLVNLVKHNDSKKEYMKTMAAGGFKDITRIASSSPTMWQHICLKNKTYLSEILGQYIHSLEQAKRYIDMESEEPIYHLFETSKNYRNSIPDASRGPIKKTFAVYCDIVDETGGIATIATILASNNISLKNIGIVHNREFEEGVLCIEFYDETSSLTAANLLKKYRYIVYER